jgi:8-oxo-dGTP pyrophosphatase MutT (NUDIX family)
MSDWQPHVTVATVVEDQGRFLLVEEEAEGRIVFNQPAGHLEPGETLLQAALRETLEETGWQVALTGVISLGLYTAPANGVTYVRTTFAATPVAHDPARPLEEGIRRAVWLTPDEILALGPQLRSPLVHEVVAQYLRGERHPLSMVYPQ